MNDGFTITCSMHVRTGPKGQRLLDAGRAPEPQPIPLGRVPRLARLMALAVRLDGQLATGHIKDMAQVAELGHVSRARITQILNLRLLAPDIQETILFLPLTLTGHDPLTEFDLRPIAAVPNWKRQRRMWKELLGRIAGGGVHG